MDEHLRRYLRSRREYLYEFARRVGIPEDRLRRLAKGRMAPRAGELSRIAAALGVPESDLFDESPAPAAGPRAA